MEASRLTIIRKSVYEEPAITHPLKFDVNFVTIILSSCHSYLFPLYFNLVDIYSLCFIFSLFLNECVFFLLPMFTY